MVELALALLAAMLLLQALLSVCFARLVRRRSVAQAPTAPCPAAEVLLCLRGVDPSLPGCLAALAAQRYGGPWRLLVVVDSLQDPAWGAVHTALAQWEAAGQASWCGARVLALAPQPAGSRKSAALHQALGALDAATQLVALVDADAVVGPHWLHSLASACGRPGVGAAGGNRWYLPERRSGPGMVRAIWNAGALVLMTLLAIPWGGSLAVRRELVEASGWRQRLQSSLCEDTALTTPLRRMGMGFRFEPALLAIDRDDSLALVPLIRWIGRQLLTARLHHPAWPLVALHGLGTSLVLLGVLGLLAVCLVQGQAGAAALLALGLLLYELGCGLILRGIQGAVAAAIEPDQRLPLRLWLRWLPLAQLVYGLATLWALLARRVEWRGVHYRVLRAGVVPLSVAASTGAARASIAAGWLR